MKKSSLSKRVNGPALFEHRSQPLLTRSQFLLRIIRSFLLALFIIAGALGVGVAGYHFICELGWIDAVYNSSMILTGMGPVAVLTTDSAKLFASAYALFSGFVILIVMGVTVAPPFHRMIHRFHLDEQAFDEC